MRTKFYPPMGFVKKFNEAVLHSKLSVTEIAKRSGVSRNTIYEYMWGKITPNITVLMKLCKTLNVSADYLLGLKK